MAPAESAHLVRFGEFELDTQTRELSTNGHKVSLQEQPFQLLLALIERQGELVTRDELKKRLWPAGTFVDFDRSLNTAVNRLRAFLDDPAEHPRFIESLPRRGYRFLAKVNIPGLEDGVSTNTKAGSHKWRIANAAAVAIAIALLVVLAMVRFRHAVKPPREFAVVIGDFANTTGEPIFEGTLRQGLTAALEQSPFLNVTSEEQIGQTLQLMGQLADSKLTPPVVNQICRRHGDSASIVGSIGKFENQYVVALHAETCETNERLAEVQVIATDRNGVLKAVSKAATELRGKLGESLSAERRFNTPLDQATTPSIEALQAYTLGRRALWKRDDANAVLFFQRAVQLDPNFALAYSALGMSYVNLGESVLGAENTKKAYELRGRVSERERFYIESHYFENVLGDLEKARRVYEVWQQTYPSDVVPAANLGGIYTQLGQYEKALAEDLRTFRVDPSNASSYADRVADYIYLNRLEEAEATAKQAISKNLDSPKLRTRLYVLAFLQNDVSEMEKQVSWASGTVGVEDKLLALEAETAAYRGRFTMARQLSRKAVIAAQNGAEMETAARYEMSSALRSALVGQDAQTRAHVASAMKISKARDVQAGTALALAIIGDTVQSQKPVNDLAKRFPEDTVVQFIYLPAIRAQIALSNGKPGDAISVSDATVMYELGDPGEGATLTALYLVYVRAQASLATRDGAKAATEFQNILSHPGVVENRVIGALARLGLARAYRLQGKEAQPEYQEFLDLWKDADPNIPILKQAKAEYANLQ